MESAHDPVEVARQPLFDAQRRVLGYELRGDATTLSMEGFDTLTGGRMVFMPVSEETVLAGGPAGVTPDRTVLQIPGTIDPSPAVRNACADLRRRGFRIALDRFVPADDISPLMRYVDFVTTQAPHATAVIERPIAPLRAVHQPSVVAVDVDTIEDFERMVQAGCTSVQGDFITHPKLTSTKPIPAARLTWLRLVKALQDPELSVMQLEELIKPDAALCLRVLRAVNGAAYAQQRRIESLRQALLLVGMNTMREWAAAWALTQCGQGAPTELIVMASVRGRFCETMTKSAIASTSGDGFLLGMCSLLDAILEAPMDAVLRHLPLCEANEAALRGEHNSQRALLDAAIAYEHGRWEESRALAASAGVDPSTLGTAYGDAIRWMARFQELAAAA